MMQREYNANGRMFGRNHGRKLRKRQRREEERQLGIVRPKRPPRPRPPPHLTGKEIGLFYRDLRRNRNNLSLENKLPVLNIPDERQKKIKDLLDSLETSSDDITEPSGTHFEREYLDIISVPFMDKLDNDISIYKPFKQQYGSKEKNEELRSENLSKLNQNAYLEMLKFRKELPAYKMRHEIMKSIKENQVVVISGDTGCGKTTQVGQVILEQACAEGYGSEVRILITQPRRLAATSVAARIANERGEILGNSIGYCIRLDSVSPRNYGSIEVVTTGVVLQRLQKDPGLLSVSHLLLDEVHERDATCDMLMAIVKMILTKRKDLKLILMSATMESERFSRYFGSCPMVHIPGRMFPVAEYFLEDVLEMTGFNAFPPAYRSRDKRMVRLWRNQMQEHNRDIRPYVERLRTSGRYSNNTLETMLRPESEEMCMELVVECVLKLCRSSREGAILVFLPGMVNISRVCRLLEEASQVMPPHIVLPLHSHLNSLDQNAIFNRPPKGVRKIIVSTNIAETSITIDDVVFVIDCGRMKIGNYDVDSDMRTLNAEWESVANAEQRKGRAGRVTSGECYRLYAEIRGTKFCRSPAPEVQRSPVHEPLLAALLLRLHDAPAFLSSLLDPPQPNAVQTAITLLTRMGILTLQQQLTPLGVHVARLPVAPGAARMLLLASLLSAMKPASAVAAVVAFRDPFLMPIGKERQVEECRRVLSKGSGSDQLAAAEAQRRWESLEQREASVFCRNNFLSERTLQMLRDMKHQFAQLLHTARFIPSPDPDADQCNLHSQNTSLLKALIVAGLYPNVASYRGRNQKKLLTHEDGGVNIHPSSVNYNGARPAPHIVFRLKQRSTKIFLFDTSPAHAFPLIFFGDNVRVADMECGTSTDECIIWSGHLGWKTDRSTAELVQRLRGALHLLLQRRLQDPRPVDWKGPDGKILKAIIELITAEDSPQNVCDSEDDVIEICD